MSDREDLISAEEAVEDNLDEENVQETEEIEETEEALLESDESEEPEDSEPEPDESVQQAKKYGHLSKEEWIAQGRDPDQWKSPEEFNNFGKMYDQLKTLNKKIDQRDREIQALVEYQKRTSQREYERAKQDLQERLAASKDDMDMEGVAHYTKELTRLEDMEKQDQVQQIQSAQSEAEQRFVERNAHWYNDRNPDLKAKAFEFSGEYQSIYPNATPEELAGLIERRMKAEYPERVSGQTKSRPTVAPSQSSVNKTAANTNSVSKTFRNLSQIHKDTFTAWKRIRQAEGKELTEAEFIARLKKDGEL